MDLVIAISGVVSMLAAVGAIAFAWLTVHEARAVRREEAHERRLRHLHRLVDLAAAVATAGKSENWSESFGVAQLQLSVALTGESGLPSCRELTLVDVEHSYDVFLEAQEEVGREIEAVERCRMN